LQDKPTAYFRDRYCVIKLKSLSDIIEKKNIYKPREIAIFGDINFYDINTKAAPQIKRITTRSDKLMRLPYSRLEVDSIAELCNAHHLNVRLYTDYNATETSFKAMSGHSPQIIHISSHAYNLNLTYGGEPVEKRYEDGGESPYELEIGKNYSEKDMILMYGKDNISSHIDPMKRNQGLFLAGAGPKWNDGNYAIPDNADDGILMAKEIENLDLRKTDLVVLSACETGWNKDNISLARSFLTAGVKTVIMSLWQVDDKVTAEFMISFYKHWIQCGDKLKAFKDCQTDIRKKYPSPYYWAAFVMMI
jgi:CHAT domain-containing protein